MKITNHLPSKHKPTTAMGDFCSITTDPDIVLRFRDFSYNPAGKGMFRPSILLPSYFFPNIFVTIFVLPSFEVSCVYLLYYFGESFGHIFRVGHALHDALVLFADLVWKLRFCMDLEFRIVIGERAMGHPYFQKKDRRVCRLLCI